MEKTSTGLQENIAGLLCYAAGWVSGILFLILEPANKFVRFHAMQSIYVFGTLSIINIVLGWIPVIAWFMNGGIWALGFILWVVLMVKAYQGEKLKLPWAGERAEKWANR